MTNTIQILTAGMNCFVAEFGREEHFTIGTVEQFYADCKNMTEEVRAMKIAEAHASKEPQAQAWAMKSGACITNCPAYYERFRAKCAAAIEIKSGQVVQIGQRLYTVKLMGARYSDPVHFVPALPTLETAAA